MAVSLVGGEAVEEGTVISVQPWPVPSWTYARKRAA